MSWDAPTILWFKLVYDSWPRVARADTLRTGWCAVFALVLSSPRDLCGELACRSRYVPTAAGRRLYPAASSLWLVNRVQVAAASLVVYGGYVASVRAARLIKLAPIT